MIGKKIFLLLVPILLYFPIAYSINAYLVLPNGTMTNLSYDRVNSTLGSFSYKDNSIVNPNIYLKVCGLNESYNNTLVDLLYSSESGNTTISILTSKPQIYNITNSCALVDVDISAFRALYPAIPFFAIYKILNQSYFDNITNTTKYNVSLEKIYFSKMNETYLNGSYLLGVDIDDVTKQTFLTVQKIFDQNGTLITNGTRPYLIITIGLNGQPIKEKVTSPHSTTVFDYQFHSTEVVYVNGMPSLRVKVVGPCSVINETGYYYIINESAWNLNKSCLRVENVSNIVVDFANKTIDGDANVNGSYKPNTCGVTVVNSANLTLKDVRTQQFNRGVCIINSKNIKIFGTDSKANEEGIYVKNSTAKISSVWLNNTKSEITLEDNSLAKLNNIHLLTANISAEAKDVKVKNVFNPPKDPPGMMNISQWVNISKNGDAWLNEIKFHFSLPNEEGVIPKTIYKFDGLYINGTWQNESWVQLVPSYVDVINRYIFSPLNITNFSIFVPFGEKVNHTQPVPKPKPTPSPSAVSGGPPEAIPPKLNLTLLNKTITLQQGETGKIFFNISNNGEADVFDVRVDAQVRKGWERVFKDFNVVKKGETKTDSLLISVYENEVPGVYWVPIKAMLRNNNVTVDVKLLKVIVTPRKRVARIDILEIPPFLSLTELSSQSVAVLIKNTGDYDLNDLHLKIENGDKCISGIDGSYSLKVGEKKSLSFTLHTKSGPQKCDTVFIFESDKGPVGLYPVIIKVNPSMSARGWFYGIRIIPIIIIIWTIITIWSWVRKK